MAATDTQALTRAYRPTSNLSKSTRLNVPQFLQKLYEMVNEPNNNDLIRWSDTGDSFIVLDHERFAREVLGRWFKHQNFQSFVRQLNMYGFHKIPSLQQGVLKSETDNEVWNFEHPHFRQGQPDLLCLISRKKQASQQHNAIEDVDPQVPGSPVATAGTVLDLNSIVTGIQAIKRHQQTISADLNELKSSNQSLWQEALAARERHNKQQDMINRILKFLASVFGRHDGQTGKDHHRDSVAPSPPLVRTQRLMIGAPDRPKKGVEVVEVDDDDDRPYSPTSTRSDDGNGPAFAHIESTASGSATASPNFTPATTASVPPDYFDQSAASTPWLSNNPFPASHPLTTAPTPTDSQLELHRPQSTQPTGLFALPAQQSSSQDAILQAAYQHLMHSPAQMQRFLEAIAQNSGSNSTEAPSHVVPSYGPPPPLGPLSFDYSQINPDFAALLPKVDDPVTQPLLANTEHLSKAYQSKNEIDADVDLMHANINRLIENMGLDASALSTPAPPQSDVAPSPEGIAPAQPPTEFDFYDFLNPFPANDSTPVEDPVVLSGPTGQQNMAAFMDDITANHEKAQTQAAIAATASKSRKRRSDAAELEGPSALSSPTSRSKKVKA